MRKTTKPQLTDKQKRANDEYIANPKISKSEAIRRAYNVKPENAGDMVPKVFNTPAARRYREDQAETAANNIFKLANDKSIKPEVQLKANQDILDRTDGKATQKSINQSQTVKIIADFTGGAAGPNPGGQAGPKPVVAVEVEPLSEPQPPETPEADPSLSSSDG